MVTSGPILNVEEGQIIENMIITASPDDSIALKIMVDNVIVRNVVIHHPANGIGIFAKRADNIIIENVEVIAYGNEWGAQPCPSAWPTAGVNCNNISIFDS